MTDKPKGLSYDVDGTSMIFVSDLKAFLKARQIKLTSQIRAVHEIIDECRRIELPPPDYLFIELERIRAMLDEVIEYHLQLTGEELE